MPFANCGTETEVGNGKGADMPASSLLDNPLDIGLNTWDEFTAGVAMEGT